MAQKFSSLEEAAQQLGISKDRLTQLREAGKVRGYRDGGSWKFRGDDIEKLVSEGIPTLDPPASDIDMGSGLSLGIDRGIADKDAASSGLDLAASDDESLISGAASDLNLDEIDEPTVAGEDDDSAEVLALDPDDDLLDLSDSILLSENELGGAANRPPSTIIGKAELDPDLDLTLHSESESTALSDVRLAATSDVLTGGDDSLDLEPPSLSDNFQGLAEVDVDLEAESSRILSPGDSAKAKGGAKGGAKAQQARQPAADSSDLELAASSSVTIQPGSDIALGSDAGSRSSLTGLSALELDDDDQVLGDGSDITLSSESSGINIISPSDSGLALDEVALSSASMSSPLDLGGGAGGDEVSLEPLELSDDDMEGEEPFQLTPLGEADDEEKDSSQVIALDELAEEGTAGVMFQPTGGDGGALGEDFASVGLTPGMAPVATTSDDVAVSGWVFGLLTCNVLLLLVCGMMMFDLVRNIWSWNDVTTLNSTLMDVVNPLSKS